MRGAQDFFFEMTQQNEGRLLCVGTWTKETQTPTHCFVVDLLLKSNQSEVKGDIFMLTLCECLVFFRHIHMTSYTCTCVSNGKCWTDVYGWIL